MVKGGGDEVHKRFLVWKPYLAYKKRMLEEDSEFKDPGRTTFLSTRCPCLGGCNCICSRGHPRYGSIVPFIRSSERRFRFNGRLKFGTLLDQVLVYSLPFAILARLLALLLPVAPKVSQCACQIHTQQEFYLKALTMLWPSIHGEDCECGCAWCTSEGCDKWRDMSRDLSTFSQALACEKVDLLAGDPDGGYQLMGRKRKCVAMKCAECGFGGLHGIPLDCEASAKCADRPVGWIRFQDQVVENGTKDGAKHSNQQVPVVGTLQELWQEFMEHSAKVIVSCTCIAWLR